MPKFKKKIPAKTKKVDKVVELAIPPANNHKLTTDESTFLLEEPAPKRRRLLKVLLSLLCILIGLGLILAAYVSSKIREFEEAAHISFGEVVTDLRTSWQLDPFPENDSLLILLLGLDVTQNRQDEAQLTDTMMLISLKPDGKTSLISLPRDLWIDSLKTKINALYYYGEASEDTTGVELVKQVMEDITGQQIDKHLIIDMDSVKELIDTVGGIDILVDKSFVDTKYPKENGLEASDNPDDIYQTVSFEAGWQHFDGDDALKFIRSRQSEDPDEGTDLARSKRQQKVFQALLSKLQDRKQLLQPDLLGRLYRYWNTLDTNIDSTYVMAMARELVRQPIRFEAISIPVADETNAGIITNPPIKKYNLWVYEPIDTSWGEFRSWIQQHL